MRVQDLSRAMTFWTEALSYEPKRKVAPEDDFVILVPVSGNGAHIALDVSDSSAPEHPAVHLDLYAGDAADQAAEVGRLVALGATRVDWDFYSANPDYIVLADTEGNRFCIIDSSHS